MSITLPTMLSFDRKLENSDALMYSGNWNDIEKEEHENQWTPIQIIPRQNRSTQSAEGIADENKTKPNPVAASNDDANLPFKHDTLKVSFTLRVVGNLGTPFACNSPDFEKEINKKVAQFKCGQMIDELAYRYAYNIANGRFLWRNRVAAEEIKVRVAMNHSKQCYTFDAYSFSMENFEKNRKNADLQILAHTIKQGLISENDFVLITVNAFVKLGYGQHVFPSQEMNMGEKRKVLFKIAEQEAMHNVKIGNALRTIDNWYDNAEFPIAAEPYGAVTQRGRAYRESKNDLYTLLVDWVNDQDLSNEQQAYIVANLIRGGVFSKGSE